MTARSLTQARLKELLHYNPDTGVFMWLLSRGGALAGNQAGCCNGKGYIVIGVDKVSYEAHRLAFLYVKGMFPTHGVDHENHIRSDNAWSNLRKADHSENAKNTDILRRNTSGTTGVSWNKQVQKWRVFISVDKCLTYGGAFKTKQEAITRRKQLEVEHNYHANHGKRKQEVKNAT